MKSIAFLLLAAAALAAPASAPATEAQSAAPAAKQWLAVLSLARPELLHPSGWTEADAKVTGEHFAYLKKLTADGVVLLAGRTMDEDAAGRMPEDSMGIVIFEAPDRAAAEAIVAADPAVKAGIFRTRLHSYRVALSR